MYYAEITYRQGTNRESGYEMDCPTLESAVRQIERWAEGMGLVRAWINNREVRVRCCHVVGSDGEPFCINPGWHRTFAPYDYPQILERAPFVKRVQSDPEVDAVNRVHLERALEAKFRPQPTRGTGPTNPATLVATGRDGE